VEVGVVPQVLREQVEHQEQVELQVHQVQVVLGLQIIMHLIVTQQLKLFRVQILQQLLVTILQKFKMDFLWFLTQELPLNTMVFTNLDIPSKLKRLKEVLQLTWTFLLEKMVQT
jgi:hypothetical protein